VWTLLFKAGIEIRLCHVGRNLINVIVIIVNILYIKHHCYCVRFRMMSPLNAGSLLSCSQIKGSANFSLCVKDMMPLDVADHFRGTVSIWASVSSIDGSRQTTFDDSTPVHKQLIDIKYSKDTRKQFKPGLPYKGKVRHPILLITSVSLGQLLALDSLGWSTCFPVLCFLYFPTYTVC